MEADKTTLTNIGSRQVVIGSTKIDPGKSLDVGENFLSSYAEEIQKLKDNKSIVLAQPLLLESSFVYKSTTFSERARSIPLVDPQNSDCTVTFRGYMNVADITLNLFYGFEIYLVMRQISSPLSIEVRGTPSFTRFGDSSGAVGLNVGFGKAFFSMELKFLTVNSTYKATYSLTASYCFNDG